MFRILATLVAAALLVAAPLQAQEASPPFRVGSELVVVDLIATDRTGAFVPDLQPSEIQVLEDGRPQRVQFVRLVRTARSRAATPDAPPPSTGSPERSGIDLGGPDGAAVLMLTLDFGSMPPDALPRVRAAVAEMVRNLPDGASMMLATFGNGIEIRQPLTSSRGAMLAAIDALPGSLSGHLTLAEIVDRTEQACDLMGEDGLIESAVTLGRSLITEARQRSAAASDALGALSRSLAAVPGRKHVIFYSAGYFTNPVGDVVDAVSASLRGCARGDSEAIRRKVAQDLASADAGDTAIRMRTAIDRANRSQVSFYAVDPRGLVTTSLEARQRGSARSAAGGALQKVAAIDQARSQDYLHAVASGTGGRAFLNTNDLTEGLQRAWLDATEYYLIGYAPAGARRKGQFRTIEVKLARAGIASRYRRGYYESSDAELARVDVEIALRYTSAFERDLFEVEAVIEGSTLRVIAYVPPGALRFAVKEGLHHGEFGVHATLRDAKGALVRGKPLFGRDITMRLPAERFEALQSSEHVEVRTDAETPPPGTYSLTVAVRDRGGWIAARSIALTVVGR